MLAFYFIVETEIIFVRIFEVETGTFETGTACKCWNTTLYVNLPETPTATPTITPEPKTRIPCRGRTEHQLFRRLNRNRQS